MNKSENHEEALILDHEYDGIQELDNPLPGWWLMTFYITIFFSILYVAYYGFGSGLNLSEAFQKEMELVDQKKATLLASRPEPSPEELIKLTNDQKSMQLGKSAFDSKCASCHGVGGAGGIGPNLADRFWIHGKGDIKDIFKTVRSGVLEKGMPAWGSVLSPEELSQVVAYVYSLKNSNPPNPKAPQGMEVP